MFILKINASFVISFIALFAHFSVNQARVGITFNGFQALTLLSNWKQVSINLILKTFSNLSSYFHCHVISWTLPLEAGAFNSSSCCQRISFLSHRADTATGSFNTLLVANYQSKMLTSKFKALKYYPYLFLWLSPCLHHSPLTCITLQPDIISLQMFQMLTLLPLIGNPYSWPVEFLIILYNPPHSYLITPSELLTSRQHHPFLVAYELLEWKNCI